MGTRLVHIVIDAAEPGLVARFWGAVLGWEITGEDDDEVEVQPSGFSYPDPAALPLVFVPVPEPKTGKNRAHLDLAPYQGEDHAAAVGTLIEAGALATSGRATSPGQCWPTRRAAKFRVLSPRGSPR